MGLALIVESSMWYAMVAVLMALRFTSHRIVLGSFKQLQPYDVLATLALMTYTTLLVVMNIQSVKKTNLFDLSHPPLLTPEEVSEREYGSKLVLVSEQMQILTIWFIKGCFLLMYNNLTFGKCQQLCVKLVAGYVALGFVLMEILYMGVWCRPFSQYWEVPPHNIQCSASTNHLITNATLNISSDLFIIAIPMPILFRLNSGFKKKAILSVIFGLGFFTIGCAIANKYYSFHRPYDDNWTFWYIRESSTALIVANLPFLWAIVRFAFKMTPLVEPCQLSGAVLAMGQRYGHNVSHVGHSITITRGPRNSQVANNPDTLDSQEDLQHLRSKPLKIYRRQEVHVSAEKSLGESVPMSEELFGCVR